MPQQRRTAQSRYSYCISDVHIYQFLCNVSAGLLRSLDVHEPQNHETRDVIHSKPRHSTTETTSLMYTSTRHIYAKRIPESSECGEKCIYFQQISQMAPPL